MHFPVSHFETVLFGDADFFCQLLLGQVLFPSFLRDELANCHLIHFWIPPMFFMFIILMFFIQKAHPPKGEFAWNPGNQANRPWKKLPPIHDVFFRKSGVYFTYRRKIPDGHVFRGRWSCQVQWTGYTHIQRCEMTREMTMTAPECQFCRFMWQFGWGAFAWQSGSAIIRHIMVELLVYAILLYEGLVAENEYNKRLDELFLERYMGLIKWRRLRWY